MELKEIREVVSEILSDIEKNKSNLTYRKYETFFERIGMTKKRNFDVLSRFDYQFKKNNLTLWCGKEELKKISLFRKGETITFRQDESDFNLDNIESPTKQGKVKFQHAGTVTISESESGITPYDHQYAAFAKLNKEIIKSDKNPFAGLLVLPTGAGKTLTAAHWISKNILDKNKKVLWIAHRHELLEQAQQTFTEKLAFSDIFTSRKSFSYRLLSGIHDKPINIRSSDDIIIASKDSLNTGFDLLNKNWIKNKTDEIFLVVDEAHHATAKSYRRLIKDIQNSVTKFRMLGLTATPFRTAENEQGLLAKVFPDDIIYKIDLRTLIRLNILSEPHFEEVQTGQNFGENLGLTFEQIEKLKYFDIDTIGKDIAKSIAENFERNMTIVNKYVTQKKKYKQTLVFALNIDNAIALNALFRDKGIKSDYVVSTIKDIATGVSRSAKDNKEKIAKFRSEELEVLINVNILTEGMDVPNVQSIFLARPTISTILMTQMIGRGLRGLKAGGTKEAFIVSFIDEWQNKITWVNPEKLFIEENIDFADKDKESEIRKQLIRLVAINKIEEFAILTNQMYEPEKREELEKLQFIERFPIGIYQFRYLFESDKEPVEKHCEILVYNNILQSYVDFMNALPMFFTKYKLKNKDILTDEELHRFSNIVEQEFFYGCLKYPAYLLQDIKDVLQYYAIQEAVPTFIELKDREKYDIDKIAAEIFERDLGSKSETEFINEKWKSGELAWQTFFNTDLRGFLREIDLAKRRISHPELFQRQQVVPDDKKELRELEKLSLQEIREVNPTYAKSLSDAVYKKFTDIDGNYYCKVSGYRSKNKLDFQIDHIKSRHNGGLTVLANLQLLKRSENAKKGKN